MPTAIPTETPRSDIVEEALALVEAGNRQGLTLRLIGGVAIRLRTTADHPAIARSYKDIDLVAARQASTKVSKLFVNRGYTQDEQFNAMHGHFRLIYFDPHHGRQVDVFVGKFEMCHSLPVIDRLKLHPLTLPPADLLLTKLQIFELNDKDQRDLLALLLDHEIGDQDADQINARYIAELCAGDWGLWRTCTRNLDRLGTVVSQYDLSVGEKTIVTTRLGLLKNRIAAQAKSMRWKARSLVGERVQWYELPEEVAQ